MAVLAASIFGASVTVAAAAILVAALAALDSCLSPVWRQAMVYVSSYLAVALAASDFGHTDGISASSDSIGCSDSAVVSVVSNSDFCWISVSLAYRYYQHPTQKRKQADQIIALAL